MRETSLCLSLFNNVNIEAEEARLRSLMRLGARKKKLNRASLM
jgi:hypothetical protein